MSQSAQPSGWDGPWYRVHTEQFEAMFLLDADEDLDAVNDIDVEVRLRDGSRWSATICTVGRVETLMERWATSGEALGGRYYWCPDGLIIRDAGISNMVEILAGLVDNGEFTQVLNRLDD
ncbi:hypothetical protein ACIRPT_26600 [Streptomyces sp. NPDC101227]|uniref:hypothetical protein n=1 Tax=Streptomyces sp. NPDC101227 TaxID=3366136 RepID=UPI0037FD9278